MHRPTSPLLHDYKPTAARLPKKSKALQWFVVGLGIPLLGLALVSTLGTGNDNAAVASPLPVMTAIESNDVSTKEFVDTFVVSPIPLVLAPEPEYETLTLTIRSGDTLDELFRKHQLDIGHLTIIARLDAAAKQFRKIKAGDIFEITHDDGKLISIYSALNLTSALKVDRQESGFTAEIVERPIEKRKRLAYGVIENSLFESAAAAGLSDKLIMNIAGIFAWDVDFVLDIRTGDNYYVQYEEVWQDGEFVTDGEIIIAEFNNNGRRNQAI